MLLAVRMWRPDSATVHAAGADSTWRAHRDAVRAAPDEPYTRDRARKLTGRLLDAQRAPLAGSIDVVDANAAAAALGADPRATRRLERALPVEARAEAHARDGFAFARPPLGPKLVYAYAAEHAPTRQANVLVNDGVPSAAVELELAAARHASIANDSGGELRWRPLYAGWWPRDAWREARAGAAIEVEWRAPDGWPIALALDAPARGVELFALVPAALEAAAGAAAGADAVGTASADAAHLDARSAHAAPAAVVRVSELARLELGAPARGGAVALAESTLNALAIAELALRDESAARASDAHAVAAGAVAVTAAAAYSVEASAADASAVEARAPALPHEPTATLAVQAEAGGCGVALHVAGGPIVTCYADDFGEAVFRGVPHGLHWVETSYSLGGLTLPRAVHVGANDVEELRFSRADRPLSRLARDGDGTLVGVVTSGGRPVPKALVLLQPLPPAPRRFSARIVDVDEHGAFRVERVPAGAAFSLLVSFGRREGDVRRSEVAQLVDAQVLCIELELGATLVHVPRLGADLAARAGAALRVDVRGDARGAARGAAAPGDDEHATRWSCAWPAEGELELRGLEPGSYRLDACAGDVVLARSQLVEVRTAADGAPPTEVIWSAARRPSSGPETPVNEDPRKEDS